ncbi:MAG: hypothetical protein ACLGHN_00405 [Bacteriovoracia bacterium]
MKKIFTFVVSSLFVTSMAMANSGGCSGKYKGQSIIVKGLMSDAGNKDSAQGSVSVGGRVVADFEGTDLKINYIFQSFKVRNNRGDLIEGKVTSLSKQTGIIKRLYVPSFGIDYRNIPMTCWVK